MTLRSFTAISPSACRQGGDGQYVARGRTRGGHFSAGRAPAPGGDRRNSFPAAPALAARPSFKFGKVRQALIDVGTVICAVLFIGATAACFVVAPIVLFFVRT